MTMEDWAAVRRKGSQEGRRKMDIRRVCKRPPAPVLRICACAYAVRAHVSKYVRVPSDRNQPCSKLVTYGPTRSH